MGEEADRDVAKYGAPFTYDKSFNGPLAKRSCTDVICLLIFLVFLVAWAILAYFAFRNGDLNKLLVPTDSLNRKCGLDSPVINKKYLFFFNLKKCINPLVMITGCRTPQVCVEKCPQETFVFHNFQGSLEEFKQKLICLEDSDKGKIKTNEDAKRLIEAERCAAWYVKSTPLQGRCLPSEFKAEDVGSIIDENDLIKAANNLKLMDLNRLGQNLVEDILNSWITVFAALIAAMVISLIFIVIMRWIATPMVWISIIGVLVSLGYGIYFSTTQYIYWRDNPSVSQHSQNFGAEVETRFQDKNTWLYLDIAVSVLLVILFIVVIFLRKRIAIAIALIKEGSKAAGTHITTMFFPIFPWVLQVATIWFAVIVAFHLMSLGDPSFKVLGKLEEKCICVKEARGYKTGGSCIPTIFNNNCFQKDSPKEKCLEAGCFFERLQESKIVSYLHAYNIMGFFWLMSFISAFEHMVLGATFATWYWTLSKSDLPFFTLTRALVRTVRYHLGTLAFGSLIIATCRIFCVILDYIHTKLKKYENPCTRAILYCMKCFFWCLEKFLRFMNKNAYIMCAIHGKNFCKSAKSAFNLLMRNILRVVTVDKITDFLFFLSKVLIIAAVGIATYFYVKRFPEQHKLHYDWVPTAIVVIGTYLITTVFFGVYSTAVDTLFLCFLEDFERNDGSQDKPYYMSKSLMKILGTQKEVPGR